jgi:hypothetical protein
MKSLENGGFENNFPLTRQSLQEHIGIFLSLQK